MSWKRGNLEKADLAAFFNAGYGQQQVLEVILGLAQKTISNYVNHIVETRLTRKPREDPNDNHAGV